MSSAILKNALQASLLGAFSNILAQLLASIQAVPQTGIGFLRFDPTPIGQFALYNFLTTPPNYLWQKYLELSFPGNTKEARSSSNKKSSIKVFNSYGIYIKNNFIKFVLDQTVGAVVNTTLFITIMGCSNGLAWPEIEKELRNNVWSMVLASYRLWPFVTIFNLAVVPFEYRILVGNLAGITWSVYLSLATT